MLAALALGALIPAIRFRWPSRDEALARLDRNTGLKHRPATALVGSYVPDAALVGSFVPDAALIGSFVPDTSLTGSNVPAITLTGEVDA